MRTLGTHAANAVVTAPVPGTGTDDGFRWHRTVAIAFSILFVIITVWTWGFIYFDQKESDFLSYWAAAKLAADGHPAAAYDLDAHRAVELTVASLNGLLPFPYPPPFLLTILPLGVLPYWLGFASWVTLTAGAYIIASRPIAPLVYRLSHPGTFANAMIGQNGFLTSAIFIAGTTLLKRHPLLGGAILGLMVLKPQLGLLFPIALLAGREWRAIAGAAASSIIVLLVALLVFGIESYVAFFNILQFFTEAMATSRWPWNEIASPFAFSRHLGIPQGFALAIHAILALAAISLVWLVWRTQSEKRVPVLAAATLLIPPYVLTYDALLLIVPMGWLVQQREQPLMVALIWLFCLLPIATYWGFFPGPNTIPLAAALSLWAVCRSRRAPHMDDPPLARVEPAPLG